MKTGLSVAEAMTKSPIHIKSTNTLQECAKEMADKHVGALLVKEGDELAGILTEQDLVRKGIAEGMDHLNDPVSSIMEKNLYSIHPGADIYEALVKMRDLNIRHLPVKDKSEFLGLLTLKDILKVQPQLFDLLVDSFELREEGQKPVFRNIGRDSV